MKSSFSAADRSSLLEQASQELFDVIIVGGGITGAGILREAASRGLRALLLEQNDFASATSSRSSKLIHGGLRYLETFNFHLVFEAAQEREILLKHAPSLVYSLPFLVPVYRGDRRGLWMVSAGVWLYELLSLFRSKPPQIRGKSATLALQPGLRSSGLKGSALYYDASTHDSRLTIATLQSAITHGGIAINHAGVLKGIWEKDRLTGVEVMDHIHSSTHIFRGRWIVNATGPWSDLYRRQLLSTSPSKLRLTKGVHVTLQRGKLPLERALLLFSPRDQRVMFLIPWQGHTLIGTTDTDFEGDPSTVTADERDVAYLLEAANAYFPEANLSSSDILSTWAGLRPLLQDQHHSPSSVSREHQIFSDAPGLMTIAGGKLTTYRRMAEELVDQFTKTKSITATELLSGSIPSIFPSADEIRSMIRNEMALTVSDILAWRTSSLLLEPTNGVSLIPAVMQVLQQELGLSQATLEAQKREFLALVDRAKSGITRTKEV